MKQLISTLWFVLIFSTAALAQTQLVNGVFYSKDPLLAGCKVFIEDGLLYGVCDGEGAKVQEPIKRSAPKRKKQEVKWACVAGPCDFIDENGNLKS